MNIVIFGAPGTGKGTQSALLIEKYKMHHLSTGDMLRAAIAAGTPLGNEAKRLIDQGMLVPDDVILRMVEDVVRTSDGSNGFVFDGFPRTLPQASALDAMLEERGVPINKVIVLAVDEKELHQRILHRARLSGRSDDNEETIRKRLDVYYQQTHPLVEYYKQQGKLSIVDGMHEIGEVFHQISEVIDSIKK